MTISFLETMREYRKRAAELRAMAKEWPEGQAKADLSALATQWDSMAARLDLDQQASDRKTRRSRDP